MNSDFTNNSNNQLVTAYFSITVTDSGNIDKNIIFRLSTFFTSKKINNNIGNAITTIFHIFQLYLAAFYVETRQNDKNFNLVILPCIKNFVIAINAQYPLQPAFF